MSEYTQMLAGLKFEKELIQQLFREGMMRESVIYQDILEEGRQEGERSLILRQLTRQVGELAEETRSHINTLSLEQLENLGDAPTCPHSKTTANITPLLTTQKTLLIMTPAHQNSLCCN